MSEILAKIHGRTGLTLTAQTCKNGVFFDCREGCIFMPWSMPITADEVIKRVGSFQLT